jgi:hypothetical protein
MFFPEVQDVLYANFQKMTMPAGSHDIRVQAKNKLLFKSASVIATTTIDTAIPVVNSKYIKPLGVLSYN